MLPSIFIDKIVAKIQGKQRKSVQLMSNKQFYTTPLPPLWEDRVNTNIFAEDYFPTYSSQNNLSGLNLTYFYI